MKKYFLIILLFLPLLTACSSDSETRKADRIAYRWEIYDINFTYPADFYIIEDRQITFGGRAFDVIIMNSTGSLDASEIEVMAQDNTKIEDILTSLDETLDYKDLGSYTVGDHEFRKICYEFSEKTHCSYFIEQNRKYYQFNLDDAYRDDFLKSVEFVE